VGVGVPLSVKLIAATSIVVAVAVAASAYFGQRTIETIGSRDAAARRDAGERAIVRDASLVAEKVAAVVAVPLAGNALGDIQPLLDAALRDEREHGSQVLWLIAVDASGQVVGQSRDAPVITALPRARETAVHGRVRRAALAPPMWLYVAPIAIGTATLGELLVGVSTAAVDAELAAAIRDVEDRARTATRSIWLVAAGVLVAGVVLAALQGIGMARPLRLLARQAERIAAGTFDERVATDRRDEIGALAHSFNRMAANLGELVIEREQRAVLERELSLARAVQESMLPPPELVRHGAVQIIGHCRPASRCGGDWWTYRPLSGDRMLIVVGDATGHGLHSAMIAATARGAVEALAEVDERLLTPEQVLRSIDSAIRNVGEHHVLMTCFAAVIGADGGLEYANAGQNFPYVVRMGDGGALAGADILAQSGNPLGDRAIAPHIRRGQIQLRPGDLFVCFTDGVVERQSPTGKLFGDRRLRGTLTGTPLPPDGASLVALGGKVLAALDTFAAGTAAEDDLTLVLCQFAPDALGHARRRSA
jgi:serine phosphatase RsbU (regulator of sigma subunit)